MKKKPWLYANSYGVFEADGKAITKERFLALGGSLLPTQIHDTVSYLFGSDSRHIPLRSRYTFQAGYGT